LPNSHPERLKHGLPEMVHAHVGFVDPGPVPPAARMSILDGFDLGVGILRLPTVRNQRSVLNGNTASAMSGMANETWLVLMGGASIWAFPLPTATISKASMGPSI